MSNSLETAYQNPSATPGTGVNYSAPDLTRHPPRSPRTRLGGYVQLPRLIDKARAAAAGTAGDFHYNCPIDQHFLRFTGLNPEALFAEIKAGKSDSEILAYVTAHTQPKRHPSEIAGWSTWFEQLTPTPPDTRAFFNDIHRKNAPQREDIGTWFDWLELDDYVTYGGKP
ncbi:MAG: hypothetical protein JWQ62_131 [Lacunisphaera sp.]|nr:hypothetical protein [Lacunisphaera sp.]